MTEHEWTTLQRTPGAPARHQALELLRLERDPVERTWPAVVELHRWAVAVRTLPGDPGAVWRESQLEAIRFIMAAAPPRSRGGRGASAAMSLPHPQRSDTSQPERAGYGAPC